MSKKKIGLTDRGMVTGFFKNSYSHWWVNLLILISPPLFHINRTVGLFSKSYMIFLFSFAGFNNF